MFGYIAVNKPELRIREYEKYHSWYCGLCDCLKKRYGRTGQLTLTYDITFLLILLSGLYEPETEECRGRCVLHPFRRHVYQKNEICAYAADMNVLMAYYKCLDDWKDERKLRKGLAAFRLRKAAKRVQEYYPDKVDRIKKAMAELSLGEAAGSVDLDKMAGYFGQVMAELFRYRQDEWSEVLYRLGFFLGKFIYLMDAYEDLEEDRRKGTYNPLLPRAQEAGFDEWCREILTMMMAECAKAFEILPIVQDAGLMRNVLYAGVWERYEQVRARREEGEKESQ